MNQITVEWFRDLNKIRLTGTLDKAGTVEITHEMADMLVSVLGEFVSTWKKLTERDIDATHCKVVMLSNSKDKTNTVSYLKMIIKNDSSITKE